ncbi:SMEK domain-containing protein [Hahella sp. CR1]|uniref:SMEK domain-containing protein n=1 Tax=Hahella sp. CR1 TaxID=2992807 RepID=UPI002441DEEA|nr:SMEK domain-containing protein [Hahella sp. CR1]MDG9667164.1 SMEK domain-containing protein [Hahella sp. CR1]
MKQIAVENELRQVVSRMVTEVELARSQGRLDVNFISEDAWIPILKELYHCPNLVNLNKKTENYPGIDLGDERDRVAFQITSSTGIDKIKHTLEQFKNRNYRNSFDEVYVFIITKKQNSYSQDAIDKVAGGCVAFDVNKHIIDTGDILKKITGLTLASQQRMLQELQHILGDIQTHLKIETSSDNTPHLFISNMAGIEFPENIYVAELSLNRESIISEAKANYGYKKKRPPGKWLVVKLALQMSGGGLNGWCIHENKIFSFYNIEEISSFCSIIDIGTLEVLQIEDLTKNEFQEYTNIFKSLLRETIRDQLLIRNIGWSNEVRQYYFLPENKNQDIRKVSWVGKKSTERTVYEKNYQRKDPSKIAHHKHLSFELSFIHVSGTWYVLITPNWLYTANLYKKSRFHDKLLSKQKRLEYNQSVRNLVRFIAYFLINNIEDSSLIKFSELQEFECNLDEPYDAVEASGSDTEGDVDAD